MYEQVERPKGIKVRAAANSVDLKKSNVKQGFGFVDNRHEAVEQRKLRVMMNNSPQMQQWTQLQAKVGNGSIQLQPMQKKENKTRAVANTRDKRRNNVVLKFDPANDDLAGADMLSGSFIQRRIVVLEWISKV